ncbi:MAG: hypothetical protein H0V53_12885 [Rubrobacter sp.]|nr:hypothetical protein [Rubrobacter sp.]
MADTKSTSNNLDVTISALSEGARDLALGRALAEVQGWQRTLATSGREDLRPIAENLALLRGRLDDGLNGGSLDGGSIGRLLEELGAQVSSVAESSEDGPPPEVAERLGELARLLSREGREVGE